jgi:hypothetical protein
MRRGAITAVLVGLLLVGCDGSSGDQQQAATSTTAAPITLGQDPTDSNPPSSGGDWEAEDIRMQVLDGIKRNGFPVTGVKRRDPEGARLFGVTDSWDVKVDGVPAFFHIFENSEALADWLETADSLGAVVVFDAVDRWALSLDTDTDRAKATSAALATHIGRQLKTAEGWQIRTIGAS